MDIPKIKRKNYKEEVKLNIKNHVPYLTFPAISNIPEVKHLLTTRLGGVSGGNLSSLNLAQREVDSPENVRENYKRIADILGIGLEDIATTKQSHTTNVRLVTREDGGKGIIKEKDYSDIDAIITNEPGLALCAFSADCVPIMFLDPVKRAIGVAHSGWKGTVGKIGARVIEKMSGEFGCEPSDIICAIGSSICGSCYEVGIDVAEHFMKAPYSNSTIQNECFFTAAGDDNSKTEYLSPVLVKRKDVSEEKYYLNLWAANIIILAEAGVFPGKIHVTDICTKCNPELLFSYRDQGNPVGNLGMFVMINQ